MRIGALVGALIGICLGLALAIGFWWTLLVAGLGVAGYAVGSLAVDARRPARGSPARARRRYERGDLADDLAAGHDREPEPELLEPRQDARSRRRAG